MATVTDGSRMATVTDGSREADRGGSCAADRGIRVTGG